MEDLCQHILFILVLALYFNHIRPQGLGQAFLALTQSSLLDSAASIKGKIFIDTACVTCV